MKNKRNWAIAAALAAATGFFALQNGAAPQAEKITATPPPSSTSETCAYAWAHQESPELEKAYQARALALIPSAEARVLLYGENCAYADRRSDFLVMETDFYVRIPTEDFLNEEQMGNWMAQGLEAALQIPREQIQGKYGFVEFWFIKREGEPLILRAPLDLYLEMGQDKSGAELYRLFSGPTPL